MCATYSIKFVYRRNVIDSITFTTNNGLCMETVLDIMYESKWSDKHIDTVYGINGKWYPFDSISWEYDRID